MNRHSSKMVIIGALMVIFSLLLMFQPLFTWAQEQNDGHPCRVALDPPEDLFRLENMNPGDVETRTIEVHKTGTSSANLYLTWDWISGEPSLGEEGSLFEQLEMVISLEGVELYRGKMIGGPQAGDPSVITDALYVTFLEHGDKIDLEITVTLPGAETGNVFQGSTLLTHLVFYTICTETPDTPAINIEKATNGVDADLPTGPSIPVGNTVTWTYVVTNPGNVPLSNIVVTDNIAGVNPVYVSGDTNEDGILQVGETWIYEATGVAVAGQYANIGTVVGTPPTGPNVTDNDPSHYFGTTPTTPVPPTPPLPPVPPSPPVPPTPPTPPTPTPPVPTPTPPPPAPVPDPDEIEEEPDEPEVTPDEPEEPDEDEPPSVIIVPPEGPRVDPPLPRTDGASLTLFALGGLLIIFGVTLRRGAKEKAEAV